MRSMLEDYFAQDLWSVIESPPGRVREHLVIGGTSLVYDATDRERAHRAATQSGGRVEVHELPDAGHWVHVDDPDGLFAIMAPSFA
jgi:pimeloyl-ACP methyl ester carboxylesterase